LADPELGLCADARQARLLLPDLVGVIGSQLVERRPLLSAPADVLALVLADVTAVTWDRGLGILGAAGCAEEAGIPHQTPRGNGCEQITIPGQGKRISSPPQGLSRPCSFQAATT